MKYVLGVDPGVNNLGWCITRKDGSVYKWGLVTKTLEDLKKPEDIKTFHSNMKALIKSLSTISKGKDKPDFIMERYMPRGMRRGNQVERINIVIGYLLALVKYKDAFMIPASSWKNYREKNYTVVENSTIPDHIVDTYTMTLYYLEHLKSKITIKDVRKRLRKVKEKDWGWKKRKGVWVYEK